MIQYFFLKKRPKKRPIIQLSVIMLPNCIAYEKVAYKQLQITLNLQFFILHLLR